MKIRKGDYGYISRQKLTRFLKTILFFSAAAGFFHRGLRAEQRRPDEYLYGYRHRGLHTGLHVGGGHDYDVDAKAHAPGAL